MTLRRSLFGLFVLVATMLVAGVASAQQVPTITILNTASLPRLNSDHSQAQKRQLNLSPEAVNLQDCVDDQLIRFTLQMASFDVSGAVSAWASVGGDCKPQAARQPGSLQICWKILDSDVPLSQTIDVDVPVRRIMSGVSPFTPSAPIATVDACGQVDLANITVSFLYFPPGSANTNATVSADAPIVVDTVGPDPPSGLKALPGNTRIQVSWINISGGDPDASATGGLTELTGVNVYCDPSTGGAPTTTEVPNAPVCSDVTIDGSLDDAGNPVIDVATDAAVDTTVNVCVDGGTTTQTAAGATCASTNFTSSTADGGVIFPTADFNAKFGCGGITSNTGTTVVATGVGGKALANGTTYAVAVAATDKYGNVGRLSDPICQTPDITTDFWDDYKKDGGAAGGCSTAGDPPVGSLALLFGLGATTVMSRVRKKKKQQQANERKKEAR